MTPRCEVIGDCTLWLGDALEIVPTLRTVDAIITDPPYAIPTLVASGRHNTRSVGDLSIVEYAMRGYLGLAMERLSSTGRMFVFCDGVSYPVIFRVLYSVLQTALLVWNKGQIGMGREFRKSHELILHGWQTGTPIFSDGIGRPDIIQCPPVSNELRMHPAEKPVALLLELIRVCGDVILDIFSGSASTAIACIKTGRRFIGIEIEERYFELGCRRIEAAYRQPDLFLDHAKHQAPTQEPLFTKEMPCP